ncbi:uncharacterized protein LOC117282409 [Cryptotermes secundus]|uniref:uncharacterized protein LOC117282409 n=1 Tax=Cryptotermes secundus TaxID=105785 RepID=UPI001454E053|nr:uncharacterized protein LOC117282409 [Cryptotermes secundus]
MNKNKRELFEKLMLELREQGFENTDVELMRKKLKTIKTVYRRKLSKFTKSKKSCAGTDDQYKPKLAWPEKTDSFLGGVTATRTSTSTLELLDTDPQEDPDGEVHSPRDKAVACSSQNGATRTVPPPMPPISKRNKTSSICFVNEVITNLKHTMNKNSEDELQQFADHIAAQLRQLPLQNSLVLQEKIQNLITRERISHMTPSSPLHVKIPQDVICLSSTPLSDQLDTENRYSSGSHYIH